MSLRSVSWARSPVFCPDSRWRASAFDSASQNSGKTRQEDKVRCPWSPASDACVSAGEVLLTGRVCVGPEHAAVTPSIWTCLSSAQMIGNKENQLQM